MDWAGADALILLYIWLTLLNWLVKSAVAFAGSRGWLSDNVTHGVLNVLP